MTERAGYPTDPPDPFEQSDRPDRFDGSDQPDRVGHGGPKPGPVRDPVRPPDISSDETDIGWGDLPDRPGGDDERILREVPPHHLG